MVENKSQSKNGMSLQKSGGLNAFQLKVLAVIFMTIDHIGAFAFDVPFVQQQMILFRSIGRLAMPIFLFLNLQSIRHTHNQRKFLLRLYLAGMGSQLFVVAMNLCFGERFYYFNPGNILFTFFYVALDSLCIERIFTALEQKKSRAAVCGVSVLLLSILPTVVYSPLLEFLLSFCHTQRAVFLLSGLLDSFLPSFSTMDYGFGLVILGVSMYLAKTKNRQCAVFAAFSCLCTAVTFAPTFGIPFLRDVALSGIFPEFFNEIQCLMLFALPILLLYNGERGKPSKWFFYVYYPVHREIIFLVSRAFVP